MPIPFTCPHCGLQTHVSEEYAGQSGPCAGCGRSVTVPPLADALNYAPPAKRSVAPIVVAVVLVLFVLSILTCAGFWVAIPFAAGPPARQAARRVECSNNLKQIAVAMLNYEATHGCFPPAYVADENGRPMHSWRVLLLPFLGEQALYAQYNFDQPWDSPQNLALASRIPQLYRCPSDTTPGPFETSYVMIVGPNTISDGAGTTKIADITDGTSNTLLVVEAAGSGINWIEPRDLNADEISYLVNDPVDVGIVSEHPEGANVAFCDGSVMFLEGMIDEEEVRAMCTIAGGEDVDKYSVGYEDADW